MTSIKQLLELGDKQSIFGRENQVNTFGNFSKENKEYILSAPKMEAKLREIVEMLPEINKLMQDNVNSAMGFGDKDEQIQALSLKDKLDKWENS